jgi:predicted amidohydrolase
MKIVSLQLEVGDRPKAENVAAALERVDQAPAADLILLPEIWPIGFFSFDRYHRESEPIDGPTVAAFEEKAKSRQCHIHMGSLVERAGDHFYNASVLISPAGDVVAHYRKIHLFGYQSDETRLLTPGSDIAVVDLPWGRCGLSTCYDLRFPGLFRRMVDQGVVFFLVASAWPMARLDAWRLFNRARAHENLAFLISCNCAGLNGGTRLAGHSMVVDPWGRVVAEGGDGEDQVVAEIDPELPGQVRAEFPALADRKLGC